MRTAPLRRQQAFQTIDQARALVGQRLEGARQMPGIFLGKARHTHDASGALITVGESGEQA